MYYLNGNRPHFEKMIIFFYFIYLIIWKKKIENTKENK